MRKARIGRPSACASVALEVAARSGRSKVPVRRPSRMARPESLGIDRGKVLEVDVEPGIGKARGGAAVEARNHLRPVEARAVEAVAVVDLGEASLKRGAFAEQAVEGGLPRVAPSVREIDVGGHGLVGWVAAQRGLSREAARQRPAGDVREGGDVGEGHLNRAGEGIPTDLAGVGRLRGRTFDLQDRHLDHVIGLERAAEAEGGPAPIARRSAGSASDRPSTLASATESEAARAGVRPGGLGTEDRLDAVEGAAVGSHASDLERAVQAGGGRGAL